MENPSVILFTGHRNKTAKKEDIQKILSRFGSGYNCLWIHGGADGFDSQIENVARAAGINTAVFKPAYNDKTIKTSRFAPLKRNDIMLGFAHGVVVLWDGRQSGGTYWTKTEAESRGIPVMVINPDA